MKKLILFPVLVAIHPILAAFAGPGKWQPIEDYYRVAICAVAFFLLTWLGMSRILRSAARAAFALSTFWFLFFAFNDVYQKLTPLPFKLLLAILSVAIFIALLGHSKTLPGSRRWVIPLIISAGIAAITLLIHPFVADRIILAVLWLVVTVSWAMWAGTVNAIDQIVPYLNIAVVGLVAWPLFLTFQISRAAMTYEATLVKPTLTTGATPLKPQPDVYLFVLDGYGRADALDRAFMFNNQPFIKELQKRGFFIDTHARSNYAQTEQSLSSELNGDYLNKLLPTLPTASQSRSLLTNLIRDNAVAKAMQDHGYDYQTISTGFPPFNRDSQRKDLSDPGGLSLAEQVVLYQTPEFGLGLSSKYLHQRHRDRIEHAFDAAASLPASQKPRYVVIHILSPHPPFVFDKDGKPVNPNHLYGVWDADLFTNVVGSKAEYTFGYPAQLQYVNKRVLQTVDRILKNSKTPPVIILQGDHGDRRDHDMAFIEKTNPSESYENLVAILAPPPVKKNLYDGMTNVNIMRAVLAGLFGGKFERLPDKSIYSTWNHPYDYTDVTSRISP